MTLATNFHSKIALEFDLKYDTKPDFIDRKKIWFGILDKYIKPNTNTFDAGCGPGIFSIYISEKLKGSVVGVDGSAKMIEICRGKKNKLKLDSAEFVHKDLNDITLQSLGKFDSVISSSVLEYIEDVDQVFEMFNDLLVEDGRLIISLPNRKSVYRKLEKVSYDLFKRPRYYKHIKNLFSDGELNRYLVEKDFRLEEIIFYGNNNIISRVSKIFGNKYAGNLFVAVFRKGEIF